MIKKEYVQAFLDATVETFSTMCGLDPVQSGPMEVVRGTVPVSGTVCVIGCSGNVRGAVMMTMSMETACMAVESFVGEEVAPGSADLTDGLGELLNIIAGAGAANLAELNVRISLPTVLIGKDQIVASKQSTPWVVIPMLLDDGHEFCLEVTMEEDAS